METKSTQKPQYDAAYYSSFEIEYGRNKHWIEFFGKIADRIVADFNPKTVLDAGCAHGILVEALRERGVDAWGIDASEYAISQAKEHVGEYTAVSLLENPLPTNFPKHFDLVVCIEVIEHISPQDNPFALDNLTNLGSTVLFSSNPGDFKKSSHIYVRPTSQWANEFYSRGFRRILDYNAEYINPWAIAFEKSEQSLEKYILELDESFSNAKQENGTLRQQLLTLENKCQQLEQKVASLSSSSESGATVEELENIRRINQAEIWRQRDLLIGQEGEIGVLKADILYREHQMKLVEKKLKRAYAIFTNPADRILSKIARKLKRALKGPDEG
jgi:SAM-dependent methyltransferase